MRDAALIGFCFLVGWFKAETAKSESESESESDAQVGKSEVG